MLDAAFLNVFCTLRVLAALDNHQTLRIYGENNLQIENRYGTWFLRYFSGDSREKVCTILEDQMCLLKELLDSCKDSVQLWETGKPSLLDQIDEREALVEHLTVVCDSNEDARRGLDKIVLFDRYCKDSSFQNKMKKIKRIHQRSVDLASKLLEKIRPDSATS